VNDPKSSRPGAANEKSPFQGTGFFVGGFQNQRIIRTISFRVSIQSRAAGQLA
jgi:hypothetical protein